MATPAPPLSHRAALGARSGRRWGRQGPPKGSAGATATKPASPQGSFPSIQKNENCKNSRKKQNERFPEVAGRHLCVCRAHLEVTGTHPVPRGLHKAQLQHGDCGAASQSRATRKFLALKFPKQNFRSLQNKNLLPF